MSSNWQNDVYDFHEKFGCVIGDFPKLSTPEVHELRVGLIAEEVLELNKALNNDDLVEVADALADIMYVVIGAAVSFGIELDPVWDEVHNSNMNKEGGTVREDGKILKPEGWEPPEIAEILRTQGANV